MSRLLALDEADLHADTRDALSPVRVQGRIPEIYRQFANSEPALRAYLRMEKALQEGSLQAREIEAIKLWVSQQTGCDYCLSVHSMKARKVGLDTPQQLLLRGGQMLGEDRLDCLLVLAQALLQTRGSLPDSLLQDARRVGLSDENLVDLALAMSTIMFTNLTNHINDSVSILPAAPELER